MSEIILCNPVGKSEVPEHPALPLVWSPATPVATLFNNHSSVARFWEMFVPRITAVARIQPTAQFVKQNTFVAAPLEMIDAAATAGVVAIVGIAA